MCRRMGFHVSIEGGLHRAVGRALERGCTALQVFVGNPRGWQLQKRDEVELSRFRDARAQADLTPLVVHSCYLINACSTDRKVLARSVRRLAAELQAAATQQATSTKEQATAMNEVSTTLQELLATSRQIAESAQRVSRISGETAGASSGGGQTLENSRVSVDSSQRQVEQIVSHMLDLGKKSQEIGAILELIDELAEQTNILSVNASIEAAGAGETGRRLGECHAHVIFGALAMLDHRVGQLRVDQRRGRRDAQHRPGVHRL